MSADITWVETNDWRSTFDSQHALLLHVTPIGPRTLCTHTHTRANTDQKWKCHVIGTALLPICASCFDEKYYQSSGKWSKLVSPLPLSNISGDSGVSVCLHAQGQNPCANLRFYTRSSSNSDCACALRAPTCVNHSTMAQSIYFFFDTISNRSLTLNSSQNKKIWLIHRMHWEKVREPWRGIFSEGSVTQESQRQ